MSVLTREALAAMAREIGADDPEMRVVAQCVIENNWRPWLLQQRLLDPADAAKLSDGAIGFFSAGVMAERSRRAKLS